MKKVYVFRKLEKVIVSIIVGVPTFLFMLITLISLVTGTASDLISWEFVFTFLIIPVIVSPFFFLFRRYLGTRIFLKDNFVVYKTKKVEVNSIKKVELFNKDLGFGSTLFLEIIAEKNIKVPLYKNNLGLRIESGFPLSFLKDLIEKTGKKNIDKKVLDLLGPDKDRIYQETKKLSLTEKLSFPGTFIFTGYILYKIGNSKPAAITLIGLGILWGIILLFIHVIKNE